MLPKDKSMILMRKQYIINSLKDTLKAFAINKVEGSTCSLETEGWRVDKYGDEINNSNRVL